jgi:hypothetical protein
MGTDVNPAMVREVIKTVLTDTEIEGNIASALVLFRNNLDGKGLSEDLQVEIKRYLAAHYVSLKDSSTRVQEEKMGDASASYVSAGNGETKEGLKSTSWGQTAISFDPTGILSSLGSVPPAWYSL